MGKPLSHHIHCLEETDGRGGGVLVYVPEVCRSRRRPDLEDDSTEAVWVELRLNKDAILLCNIYRPPNSSVNVLDRFSVMLERASTERKEIVVMGYLNCNLLAPSHLVDGLLHITDENHLKQLISKPTRITNHSQSLIDLLFSSHPDNFTASKTSALTGSDHLMIHGERVEKVTVPPRVSEIRSFEKCNKETLLLDLVDAPCHLMEIFSSVDAKWSYWRTLFLSILHKHAPIVTHCGKKGCTEWIDEDTHKLI